MKHELDVNAYVREPIESESILEALADNRIVGIEKNDEGTFTIEEKCDEHYFGKLTRQQLFDLGTELQAMALADGPVTKTEVHPGIASDDVTFEQLKTLS